MGNQNCHVDVTFQDGVSWLARFRLTKTSSPPREVRDYILRSEAATMMYLQQHTQVPTPKIFDWACESDPNSSLGAGYILMEKLDGEPLDWDSATPEQREKLMQQLVDVFLDIEKHPFDLMGSLIPIGEPPELQIQALADPAVFRVGTGGPLGPFTSSREGMRAILESHLSMIARGEIQASRSVDAYLAHLFRLDVINSGFPSTGQFFLKHPDDKGDHILVSESFDIVGIIDWEWTQTVPKEHAFCSPCMMWPVGKFYNGLNDLATDEVRLAEIFRERGRDDLSKYIIEGRKIQRLCFALGPEGSFSSQASFIQIFTGLRRVFNSSDEGWEQWKGNALKRWDADKSLCRLLELQEGKTCEKPDTNMCNIGRDSID